VQPAGLFLSGDSGQTWEPVSGLRDHPTRPQWNPGGAGLILHSLVIDPDNHDRLWVGISAAGVFHSADGGKTWEPRNKGTRADFNPDDQRYPEFGQCVHCVVKAPGMNDRLYQQNHCGMYRSDDAGTSWQSIEAGLPSSFGFPAAVHPRDPETLFLLPLNGDIRGRYVPDGKAAVWRTHDGGATWQAMRNGLPQENVFYGVLRQAMATDWPRPGGRLFRHLVGHALRQRRRGQELGAGGRAPADHPLGRDDGGGGLSAMDAPGTHAATEGAVASVTVTLAGALTYLFPGAPRRLTVAAASVGEMVAALDADWPGMGDRIVDSTPAIRRHMNVFVDGERATLDTPLRPGSHVFVLTAISGG
jgi:molybdopterin converting factor small subunit